MPGARTRGLQDVSGEHSDRASPHLVHRSGRRFFFCRSPAAMRRYTNTTILPPPNPSLMEPLDSNIRRQPVEMFAFANEPRFRRLNKGACP